MPARHPKRMLAAERQLSVSILEGGSGPLQGVSNHHDDLLGLGRPSRREARAPVRRGQQEGAPERQSCVHRSVQRGCASTSRRRHDRPRGNPKMNEWSSPEIDSAVERFGASIELGHAWPRRHQHHIGIRCASLMAGCRRYRTSRRVAERLQAPLKRGRGVPADGVIVCPRP